LISFIYFYKFIFANVSIITSDGGILGTTGYEVMRGFKNPFKEGMLWGKYFLGGQPVSQGLTEYLKNIIVRLVFGFLPGTKGYGIYLIMMTFSAGYFMFLFLRSLKISKTVSLIIGVGYMFAPVYMTFTYAGHLSKMGVIALTPLLFYFLEKGMNSGEVRNFLYLSGIIALTISTGHLQFAYYAFLSLGAYFLYRIFIIIKTREWKIILRKGILFLFAVMLGLGISTRVLYPPYIHAKTVSKRAVENTKEQKSRDFAASWSMHPEEIGSYVLPEFGNYFQYYWGKNPFKINSEYFGILFVIFSIASFYFLRKNSCLKFFLALGIFSILFSLGSHTPLFGICYSMLPGMKILRAPSFFAFITAFSAGVMAAFGLDALLKNKKTDKSDYFKFLKYVFFILIIFSFLFLLAPNFILSIWRKIFYTSITEQKLQIMQQNIPQILKGLMSFILINGILLLIVILKERNKVREILLLVLLILISLIDTWRIDKKFLKYASIQNVARKQPEIPAYEFIKKIDTSYYRIFPYHAIKAGNSRFTVEGLSMITGFSDFTLKRYDLIMQEMTLSALNVLNGKYFVSDVEMKNEPFEEIYRQNNLIVYRNKIAYPYFYTADKFIVETDENKILSLIKSGRYDFTKTPVVEEQPPAFMSNYNTENDTLEYTIRNLTEDDLWMNKTDDFKVQVTAAKPGFLVISDNYHNGWKAYIDGTETKIYKANYVWKGVFFKSGTHIIDFKFNSKDINISRKISGISILIFIILIAFIEVKKRKFDKI